MSALLVMSPAAAPSSDAERCRAAVAEAQALLAGVEADPDSYENVEETRASLKRTIADARCAAVLDRRAPASSESSKAKSVAVRLSPEDPTAYDSEEDPAAWEPEPSRQDTHVSPRPPALAVALTAALGAVGASLFLGLWPAGLEKRFPTVRDMRKRMGLGILLAAGVIGGGYVLWYGSGAAAMFRAAKATRACEWILARPRSLANTSPAEIAELLRGANGWRVGRLGRGSRAGQGWSFTEHGANGAPTGRMIRWHPGGGHHGPNPYWRVSSPEFGKSGIIPGGP